MYTLPFDHCGFIRVGKQKRFKKELQKTWEFLKENRKELMHFISIDEFLELY